jgi:isocitrate dehydrogenase kinase/phosphatase
MGVVDGVAQVIREGFDLHYQRFRQRSADARLHFERADWKSGRVDQAERIKGYDRRVDETVDRLNTLYPAASSNESLWPMIKLSYISLLLEHLQPECAETFYNSVACRVLHRRYYRNDYIFWRPTINTEHLEGSTRTYRSYYPQADGLRRCVLEMLTSHGLRNSFQNLRRDVRRLEITLLQTRSKDWKAQPNYQLQMLTSMFYRNKAAYIVARQLNGHEIQPLIIPLLQDENGKLIVDCLLMKSDDVYVLFSFARAYFMVDMEVPSAYVSFLLDIMPLKSRVDLYAMLGLQKQAKTMFYRELHHHLAHSRDNFVIAPGIRGTVMLVFTLPSFPFVFKIIRDRFDPPKKMTRSQVREKYLLVKFHDRVGRMADTLEYSNVALPLDRMDGELLTELRRLAKSSIEEDGESLVVNHVYIERRMIPLNDYLAHASDKQQSQAIKDFGQAIRDLAGANIFPGDMMQKNFGVTRHKRVVFYDYDEIEYITDCNFRRVPQPRNEDEEMSGEVWYSVGPHDVFPETFGPFLLGNAQVREVFMAHHADLLDAAFWQGHKDRIAAGHVHDVFPYESSKRFTSQPAQ